jgi:preprotein translocase subunit SecB
MNIGTLANFPSLNVPPIRYSEFFKQAADERKGQREDKHDTTASVMNYHRSIANSDIFAH